jgi:hypothetical protein
LAIALASINSCMASRSPSRARGSAVRIDREDASASASVKRVAPVDHSASSAWDSASSAAAIMGRGGSVRSTSPSRSVASGSYPRPRITTCCA